MIAGMLLYKDIRPTAWHARAVPENQQHLTDPQQWLVCLFRAEITLKKGRKAFFLSSGGWWLEIESILINEALIKQRTVDLSFYCN